MIKVVKSQTRNLPVKLYAKVPSRSRKNVEHIVTFIRANGMKRWSCTCEDQTFVGNATRKQCRHIKLVRAQILAQEAAA